MPMLLAKRQSHRSPVVGSTRFGIIRGMTESIQSFADTPQEYRGGGRLHGIDILRGLAAFGIVGCHLMLSPRTAIGEWATHFCDMNVAVFAVVAGYFTHLSSTGGTGVARRLRQLLPLYIFWTLVFLASSFLFKLLAHDSMGQYRSLGFWSSVAFRGGASCHLWFLISLVYTQVVALVAMRRGLPKFVPWVLAALGIGVSILSYDWWCFYFARLWGFVWLGIALRDVTVGSWKAYLAGTVVTVILHVGLVDSLPAFVRDALVSVPLVLFAVRLPVRESQTRLCAFADFMGATSLGVYLVHPLFARIGHLLVDRLAIPPFGFGVVLLDWSGCFAMSVLAVVVLRHVPLIRRFLR